MSCADVSRPGALRPGSKLPTEVELMGEFDVSRVVARLAVGVLRTEGLIYSRLEDDAVQGLGPQQPRVPSELGQRAPVVSAGGW